MSETILALAVKYKCGVVHTILANIPEYHNYMIILSKYRLYGCISVQNFEICVKIAGIERLICVYC